MEFIALIGIGVTVISTGVALAALILNTQRNQREEIKNLREETQAGFKALREEFISLRERMAYLAELLEGLPLRKHGGMFCMWIPAFAGMGEVRRNGGGSQEWGRDFILFIRIKMSYIDPPTSDYS